MRIYAELAKTAFQSHITFRVNTLIQLFGRLIAVLIQVSIWSALISADRGMTTLEGVVTLQEMITYTLLSTAITLIVTNNMIGQVEQKIHKGEIATDLIKPISFSGLLISESVGISFQRIIFELVPVVLISSLLFGIQSASVVHLLLFLVMVINGTAIYFLISYLFALTAFWYIVSWHFGALFYMIMMVFSGSLVPVWFFPNALSTVAEWLPFRLIFYSPISVYLGKVNGMEIIWMIVQQLIWIAILLLVQKWIWSRATTKLVVQGG
ncbi:ABC transporter permease [Cohnella silvisoli]|uniref:ABC-2 family transporter protein n=1 Tax=Cohnella silvisoli TaxID=2873699 RepID=A0ABV1KLS9_9BACL|nr:ABC-2 family transporter protein [Cohnella silvisoli]MCD9020600.1 ABC-2 family transporter protein [Cohnella silvisoli]